MIKKRINLMVTGSSQAAKAVDLYNLLKQDFEVNVIMTETAKHFVKFEDDVEVYSDVFDKSRLYKPGDETQHIAFRTNVDLNVIYPTTVDMIGKIANGLANDLVSMVVAISCASVPTLVFPGYHVRLSENPFLERNKKIIYDTNPMIKMYETIYGVFPDGDEGSGWTYDPQDAYEEIKRALNVG